jgi:pyridoxine kinase
VEDLVLGLEERDVLKHCEAALSGYLGDPATGRAIIAAVKKVRAHAPEALYCCDPVMGDVGRGFYVKPEIPAIFKDEVIPLSDIVTPNQFELEALTGVKAETLEDVLTAVDALHRAGPGIVLVTSLRVSDTPGGGAGQNNGAEAPEIGMLVSNGAERYRVSTPELYFENFSAMAGSGDLTTSVFLSRYLESRNVRTALEKTAAAVYGVMEATHRAKSRELLIVEAQDALVTAETPFRAEPC